MPDDRRPHRCRSPKRRDGGRPSATQAPSPWSPSTATGPPPAGRRWPPSAPCRVSVRCPRTPRPPGPPAGRSLARHGFQRERHGVDAPALVGGHLIALALEDVAEVGVAARAPDLGPDHAERAVLDQHHRVVAGGLVEAGPAAMGLELLLGPEQLSPAGTAPVHPFGLGGRVLARPGCFGPSFPQYWVLLRGKDLPPLCFGPLDLVQVAETTSPDTDTVDTVDTVEGLMEWLNEPSSWQRTADVLTVSVDPGTDFWRETGYGYIRDSGHVYGEVLAGDLDVSVRLRGVLEAQYDQAGVMLRADEQTWLKTGVEVVEGRPRLSTVLTLGRSSWMVTDLPGGSEDILLRVSRRGDAVEVRYLVGDGQPELAALVFMPPEAAVLAGVMCAAPEGPGFRVSFHDLQITERDWSAAPDEPGEWAGESARDGGPEGGERP